MAKKKSNLWCQTLLQSWLDDRDWKEDLEVDHENQSALYTTTVNAGELAFMLYVEAHDKSQFVTAFFYHPVKVKPQKRNEMCELLNTLNTRILMGSFTLLDNSVVRYVHCVDFEGSSPTSLSVEGLVRPGWGFCEQFGELIATVAITKQSAKEALEEFNKEAQKKDQDSSNENVPDGL